jgi:hypothetical protein
MVGNRAMRSPAARTCATARRSAGNVRMTLGLLRLGDVALVFFGMLQVNRKTIEDTW